MRKTPRSLVAACAVATFVVGATPARADEAANTATARALGIEGVTLADAGKCREAIDKLERAEQLHHAPTTAGRLGECEIEVGRLVAGTERLQRVVREPLAANAHPAFAAAAQRAEQVLERTLPRIPSVKILVSAPAGVAYELTVDGEPAPAAIVDTKRAIDPGSHEVVVSAPGYFTSRAAVVLEEGQSKVVELVLEPDPQAAAARVAAERDRSRRDSQTRSGPPPAALAAFGVGAIGLGVGIFAGVNVATKSYALNERCDAERVCPPESDSDIRSAKKWATISTIGFGTAAAGLLGGVLLTVTAPKRSTPKTGTTVRPTIGLGAVGVDGTF